MSGAEAHTTMDLEKFDLKSCCDADFGSKIGVEDSPIMFDSI